MMEKGSRERYNFETLEVKSYGFDPFTAPFNPCILENNRSSRQTRKPFRKRHRYP